RHLRIVPVTAVRSVEPRPELRPGDGLHPVSLFRITFPPVRLLLLHQAPRSSRRSVEEWFEVLTDGLAQRDGDGISDLLDDLGHRSDELVTVREALAARSLPCRDGSIGGRMEVPSHLGVVEFGSDGHRRSRPAEAPYGL